MKILLKDLIAAREGLAKVLSQDLPIKTSYRLSKVVKAVNGELKNFDEKKNELVIKYGTKDEKGGFQVKPSDKGFGEFAKCVESLINLEIDLPIEQVSLSLEDSDIKLSAIDLSNIEQFVKIEIKDEPKKKPKKAA